MPARFVFAIASAALVTLAAHYILSEKHQSGRTNAVEITMLVAAVVAAFFTFWGPLPPMEKPVVHTVTKTVPPKPSPSPSLVASIKAPGNGAEVPICTTFRVEGHLDPGYSLIEVDQASGDDAYAIESNVTPVLGQDAWEITMTLGDVSDATNPKTAGKRTKFTVEAVAIPDRIKKYLLDVVGQEEDGRTWWTSKDLPPGAVRLGDVVTVTRLASANGCP